VGRTIRRNHVAGSPIASHCAAPFAFDWTRGNSHKCALVLRIPTTTPLATTAPAGARLARTRFCNRWRRGHMLPPHCDAGLLVDLHWLRRVHGGRGGRCAWLHGSGWSLTHEQALLRL
jgi:hypothetical protein